MELLTLELLPLTAQLLRWAAQLAGEPQKPCPRCLPRAQLLQRGTAGCRISPVPPGIAIPPVLAPCPRSSMEPFCKEHWGWRKSLPYPEMGEGKKGAWRWPQHPTSPWSCWGACPGPAAGWIRGTRARVAAWVCWNCWKPVVGTPTTAPGFKRPSPSKQEPQLAEENTHDKSKGKGTKKKDARCWGKSPPRTGTGGKSSVRETEKSSSQASF